MPTTRDLLRSKLRVLRQREWFIWPENRDAYKVAKELGMVVSTQKEDGKGYRIIRGVRLKRHMGYGDLERARSMLSMITEGQSFTWHKSASTVLAAANQLGIQITTRRQFVVTRITK